MKDIKATLYLEDNATPKFHKARPVLYSLKQQNCMLLIYLSILENFQTSKWKLSKSFNVYSSGLCNRDDIIASKNRLGSNFNNYQRVSQEYEAYLERIGTEESVK